MKHIRSIKEEDKDILDNLSLWDINYKWDDRVKCLKLSFKYYDRIDINEIAVINKVIKKIKPEYLDLSNCNIKNDILNNLQLNPELISLNCGYNNLTSLPNLGTIKILDCGNNDISVLPEIPEGLTGLVCHDNKLKELPKLPDSIKTLICSNNYITKINNIPIGINTLIISNNPINKLPDLSKYPHLTIFNSNKTKLPFKNLIEYYKVSESLSDEDILSELELWSMKGILKGKTLKIIIGRPNIFNIYEVQTINKILRKIKPEKLYICSQKLEGNVLINLNLNDNLKYFNCSFNELSILPNLPNNLEILDCSCNKLKELPKLPNNLKILDCKNNMLKNLPELPEELEELWCENNLFDKISKDKLPKKLKEINIKYNRKIKPFPV